MERGTITTGIPPADWDINNGELIWDPNPSGYTEKSQLTIPKNLITDVQQRVGNILYIRFKGKELLGVYTLKEVQSYLAEEAKKAQGKMQAEKKQ